MKKLLQVTALALGILLGGVSMTFAAQSIFNVGQGGTGAGTFTSSNLLYGAGTNSIKSTPTTTASCNGTVSCTPFTIVGGSPITLTGSATGNVGNWFTGTSYGASTSTTIGFLNGLFSTASSTFNSNLFLTNLSQGVLYIGSSGLVQTNATSTLSASGPLTGSFTQLGSGGSLGIQAASAAQNGYLALGDYQLLHTATTTFTSPLIYTNSTNAVTCQTATGSVPGCLSAADWTVFNAKDSFAYPFPSSATSSLLTFTGGFLSTGSTTFSGNATTTGYLSAGTLYLPNVTGTQCLHSVNFVVSGTGSDCGAGGGSTFGKTFELGLNQYGVSALIPTTTVPIFIQSTATSSFQGGVSAPIFNATSTAATSSFANGLNLTSGCFSILGTCLTGGSGSGSTVTNYSATSTSASLYVIVPVVANDSILIWADQTKGQTTTCAATGGTTVKGTLFLKQSSQAASSTLDVAQNDSEASNASCSISMLGSFTATTTETLTIENSVDGTLTRDALLVQKVTAGGGGSSSSFSFPFTPTTNYNANANATTTPLWFQGSPYSLFASSTAILTNATSTQLTVTGPTYLAASTGNVAIGATSTPASILSIQGVANFVANAVSTIYNGLIVLTRLGIPNSAGITLSNAGDVGIETTTASTSLSYNAAGTQYYLYPTLEPAFNFASSTLAYEGKYGASGTTTLVLANYLEPTTLYRYYCKTDVGTAYVDFAFGTSGSTTAQQCTTSGVDITPGSNNTGTFRQNFYVDIGTQATNPNTIIITAEIIRKR